MDKSIHVIVFRQPNTYAGWPANHGLWQRDGRILVGFESGGMDLQGGFHAIDRRSVVTPMMAETRDGGETWECWEPEADIELRSNRLRITESDIKSALDCTALPMDELEPPVDFRQGIAKFRMLDMNRGFSYANYSGDFGRTWNGPWLFEYLEDESDLTSGRPWGRVGVNARTSYLTDASDPHRCLAFMSAAKESDGHEGQPFCIETLDGGLSWRFLSWLDDPPHGGYGIMPSAIRLDDNSILCAVRWRERGFQGRYGNADHLFRSGIICYCSTDDCHTWELISIPVRGMRQSGNPPDLVQLQDGRIVLVYGWRDLPFGIAYQTSADNGKTWSRPSLIREGAGCHDLGYTRSAVREDGKVVTVYYWNDKPDSERYIAATIWEPT